MKKTNVGVRLLSLLLALTLMLGVMPASVLADDSQTVTAETVAAESSDTDVVTPAESGEGETDTADKTETPAPDAETPAEGGEGATDEADKTETPAEGDKTPAEGGEPATDEADKTETPAEGDKTPAEGGESATDKTETPAQGTDAIEVPDATVETPAPDAEIAVANTEGEQTETKTVAYEPGTYTVTANLVVPGKYNTVLKDVDAYPTNPDNPSATVDANDDNSKAAKGNAPTMGVENNATLTVAKDGTMTLALNIPNPVFSIQQIAGCDDAQVTTVKVTGTYGLKTERVKSATFTLGYTAVTTWDESVIDGVNASGTHTAKTVSLTGRVYTFNDCKEHPTILFQDWTVPLELRVDFSNVPEKTETPAVEYTKSYTSTAFGDAYNIPDIKYTVKTTDENGAKLENGNGEIYAVNSAGETVNYVWTRTDRCKEWSKIIGLLRDADVNVDSRTTGVFDVAYTDADGNAFTLDSAKTSYSVETTWYGSCNYEVYIYDGTRVYKETEGTHDNYDMSEWYGIDGFRCGEDKFTVPAGCKAVYVALFTPAAALEPGTYTVDADLTVLGKNNQVLSGVQVYLSNPSLPPTSPMKQKGYLVVAQDGTMTLSMDGFNHIFSQQTITSGKDVKVTELRYFNLREYWKGLCDTEEEKAQYDVIPETCIDGITLTLSNYNGYYSFGDCTQYPVILFGETDMCLDLIVDFSTAVKAYSRPAEGEAAYTKTFTDASTGVSVLVETTEEWGQKLADATMSIKYLDKTDSRYADVKFQMDRLYVRDTYKVLAFTLTDKDGNELAVDGNSQATISGADVGGWSSPVVYQLKGDISRTLKISADVSDNKAAFTVRTLDPIALVGEYTRVDDGYTTAYALPFTWVRSEAADNTYSLTEYMIGTEGALLDKEYGSTASRSYLGNMLTTTMRKEASAQGDVYYAQLINPVGGDFNNTFKNITKVEVQLPYDEAKPYYYTVLTDGTSTYVKQYTATAVRDGSVYFDIINSFGKTEAYSIAKDDGTFNQAWSNLLLDALARGWNGSTPSSSAPTAYILNSDKLYAGQPYKFTSNNKTYTGTDLSDTNRVYNDSVVLSGEYTARNAGTHTYTATPAEGRTWLDGTTTPFSCEWTITQASLRAQYSGETIHEGDTPKLEVTYTGWKNGETAETASGFKGATVTAPETLTVGESYSLKPAGGESDNYSFDYRAGTLTVVAADTKLVDKPTAVAEKLVADGTEKIGVLEGEGYTLSGDWKATEGAKSYTATATLQDGYAWSDGSTSKTCNIKWGLWKTIEKPTFEKTVFEYTGSSIRLDADKKYLSKYGYNSSVYGYKNYATSAGTYTAAFKPMTNSYYMWADGTDTPVLIEWSIVDTSVKTADYTAVDAALAKIPADLSGYTDDSVKALLAAKTAVVRDLPKEQQTAVDTMAKNIEDAVKGLTKKSGSSSGSSTGKKDEVTKVTANLYLPGDYNQVIPGLTVYLNNSNNPIEGTGTPSTPKSNNAKLTTKADGTMYLTLEISNPVFTLQKIGGGSNASIESTETSSDLVYASGVKGNRTTRISSVTFKLDDTSGTYEFNSCEEFPTALNPGSNWKFPLVLAVKFDGGKDSTLDSNTNVDTSSVFGGKKTQQSADTTVTVSGDTGTVSKIGTDNLSSSSGLTIDATNNKSGVTGAKLPVSDLTTVANKKVPNVTVKLSDTSVSMDNTALSTAVKSASGKTLDVRVLTGADAEKKLNAAQKDTLANANGGAAVSVELSSDSKSITSLGGGKLNVSVPYSFNGNGTVQAWQMGTDGTLTAVPVTCRNNVATMTLSAPGVFMLETADASAAVTAPALIAENTETAGKTLKAGTYTVSANIRIDESAANMPMSPYITNSNFPPMNPTADNAQLTVNEDGSATVVIPVCIDSRVMTVSGLNGLNVIDMQKDENGVITQITVALDNLTADSTVVTLQGEALTADVVLGEWGMSASGLEQAQTLPYIFELNLSNVDTTDGEKMPVAELEMLDESVADEILAAVEGSADESAETETSDESAENAKSGSSTGIIAAAAAAVVAALGGYGIVRRKKKNQ